MTKRHYRRIFFLSNLIKIGTANIFSLFLPNENQWCKLKLFAMKKIKLLFVFILLLIEASFSGVFAQNPAITNYSVTCGQCITLNGGTNIINANGNDYNVYSIPYNPVCPYNSGTPILVNIDDHWSSIINLPFSFNFFGNNYTQLVCGSNGVISFDLTNANGYCPWSFSGSCPSNSLIQNAIFGVYHDIDPSITGTLSYSIFGSAPNRIFVLNFYQIPMFSSTCNSLLATHQIALYESSNTIDVYVENNPLCSSWNSGNSLIGIQNSTGTIGLCPPGRNTGPWSAQNEAWRFSRCIPIQSTLCWTNEAGDTLSNSLNLTVCPITTTDYYFSGDFSCNGIINHIVDTMRITVNPFTINIGNDTTICSGQQITLQADTAFVSYLWSNNSTNSSLLVTQPGNYSLIVYDSTGCPGTDSIFISDGIPVLDSVTSGYDWVCPPYTGNYSITPASDAITYLWYYSGNGATINNSDSNVVSINFSNTATNGILVAKAQGLCGISSDSLIKNIHIVPALSTGTLSTTDTGFLCPSASATLNLTGATGFINWLSSPNGSLWSTISGAQSNIYHTPPSAISKYYKVAVLGGGCPTKYTDSVLIKIVPAITEEICYVTYDPVSEKHKICWKENANALADVVNFYRYDGLWSLIGVAHDSTESYTDMISNPNSIAYSYKINKTNICNVQGDFSNYHTPLSLYYLFDEIANEYEFHWSSYSGIANTNDFYLYGVTSTGLSVLIDSVVYTQHNYNLPFFPIYTHYYIGFKAPECNTQPEHLLEFQFVYKNLLHD